jgi:hypothetical protein
VKCTEERVGMRINVQSVFSGEACLLMGCVGFCSDPDCEGHRCENGVYDPQQDDGDESADEDSCSEHSSSTSTSTNQKEGKYCDCCYCEFFGHGGVSACSCDART